MLDIHFIRENADLIKEGARKKHITADIDRLLAVDDERKNLRNQIDEKRAEQNRASTLIAQAKGSERENHHGCEAGLGVRSVLGIPPECC